MRQRKSESTDEGEDLNPERRKKNKIVGSCSESVHAPMKTKLESWKVESSSKSEPLRRKRKMKKRRVAGSSESDHKKAKRNKKIKYDCKIAEPSYASEDTQRKTYNNKNSQSSSSLESEGLQEKRNKKSQCRKKRCTVKENKVSKSQNFEHKPPNR